VSFCVIACCGDAVIDLCVCGNVEDICGTTIMEHMTRFVSFRGGHFGRKVVV